MNPPPSRNPRKLSKEEAQELRNLIAESKVRELSIHEKTRGYILQGYTEEWSAMMALNGEITE